MNRKGKAMSMAVMSAALCFSGGAWQMSDGMGQIIARAEESRSVMTLLDTMLVLIESDPEANRAAVSVLLEQIMADPQTDAAVLQMLQGVQVLLESQSTDWNSVTTLLRAAQSLSAGGSPKEAGGEDEFLREDAAGETESASSQEPADGAGTGTEETPKQESTVGEEAGTEETPRQEPAGSGETGSEAAPDSGGAAEEETAAAQGAAKERLQRIASGLPAYIPESFIWELLTQQVSVQVPSGWGNNASDRAVTSYSPVNASGAISPGAGTLTTTYFPITSESRESAFEEYEQGISMMTVTSDFAADDTQAAGIPARRIRYMMNIGANQFECEAVCFEYNNNMYAVELLQGQKSVYDYFPVFDNAVDTLCVGEEAASKETVTQTEPIQPESEMTPAAAEAPASGIEETVQSEAAPMPETEETVQSEAAPMPETEETVQSEASPEIETEETVQSETAPASENDLSSFLYSINGNTYQFPTAVSSLAEGDLPIDRSQELPYEFTPDSDAGGLWDELANTQYYFFENTLFREMAGVTNMSGTAVPITEGMITALIDMEGTNVTVVLPGGLAVGSPEDKIPEVFPEFKGRALDGIAGFRGNELLYAANVRDDGCNGYVLIRNDAPYYSALSIICKDGMIREISFECLGTKRALHVFE